MCLAREAVEMCKEAGETSDKVNEIVRKTREILDKTKMDERAKGFMQKLPERKPSALSVMKAMQQRKT